VLNGMRKSAEPMARTYGQLVGDLILQRRMAAGWTQLELALEAFEDETKVRRVVELENGQVARPQARNLGLICEALYITAQDLARCKAEASDSRQQSDQDIEALRIERGSLSAALDEVQKLKRDQLETLAIRFEMPSPHLQTDTSLRSFLELKAEEYRSYRVQIDALDERIAGLGNLKAAAQGAADRLDFDEVEALLSRVHEVEADIAAKTAEARAANALLRGQVDQAYRLLSAAADSFAGVDPLEPARRRNGYQDRLYAHGLRYGGPGMALSARMTRDALADLPQATDPALWAGLQNNLAIAIRNQGSRTGGGGGGRAAGAGGGCLSRGAGDLYPRGSSGGLGHDAGKHGAAETGPRRA
jgi:transcriptional regulator with XRE-family HTH domain